jgi:hypothetical protein
MGLGGVAPFAVLCRAGALPAPSFLLHLGVSPIQICYAPPSLVGEDLAGIPCSSGWGGVGSIFANSDALNMPAFRRWRFETWTSGRLSRGDACLASNLFFWYNSKVAVIQITLSIGIVQQFKPLSLIFHFKHYNKIGSFN